MKQKNAARKILIALIVVYAANSLFDLVMRAINLFIGRFGTPEIAIRFMEANSLLSVVLFAALPLILFCLLLPHAEGKCRRAFALLAAGRILVIIPYLLSAFINWESSAMQISLLFTCGELILTTIGLILLAFAVRSTELKVCGIIAAVAHALQSVMTLLSLLAGIMLTGNGYFRLWVTVMSYSSIAGFVIGVAESVLVALTLLMLLLACFVRESAAPAPVETAETQEVTEHVSENDCISQSAEHENH